MEPKKIIPIDSIEAEPKHKPEKKAPPAARSLFHYALILLCVAFVLVLLSYLSHQQQQWANIQEEHSQFSVSAMQNIQSLQDENDRYAEDMSRFQSDLDAVTRDRDALRLALEQSGARYASDTQALREELEQHDNAAADAAAAAEKQRDALDYLWRVEVLVSARRYSAARELLIEMRDAGLPAHLTSVVPEGVGEDEPSAFEEYERLVDLLMDD